MKKRVVVICPGRGTYTKDTLGYLRLARERFGDFLSRLDQLRSERGFPTLRELDEAATFQPQLHTKGEHASPLIYACSAVDYFCLNPEKFEVVAVTGNSMGWYSTLAVSGALAANSGFEVIQTMGAMMKDGVLGGQVIYPIVREDWTIDPKREMFVTDIIAKINTSDSEKVFLSIRLGGYLVLGGNREGVARLLKELPKIENYPFQLVNHAAFHTPLLSEISALAFESLGANLFSRPQVPVIDGRGHLWQPWSCDVDKLYRYTLGHQVVEPYDYSKAIEVALKEFAPDHLVLLGPGNSLGGATAQILIRLNWRGLNSKSAFIDLQKRDPFLLSFGMPEQRSLLI